MKVFISWSGTSSRLVAEALSDWLQRVIQAVKPFYSPDIDKGAKWSNEIDNVLEETRFGIICLTPDNLRSEWIHYEAGALSKTKDASIWTFLLGLKPSEVKQPLGRFQHTVAEKADVWKMVKSINTKLVEISGESVRESLLEEIFEENWSKLEKKLVKAKESVQKQPAKKDNKVAEIIRGKDDKIDEVLEILRSQQRNESYEDVDVTSDKPSFGKKRQANLYTAITFLMLNTDSDYDLTKIKDYLYKIFPNSLIGVNFVEKSYSFFILVKFMEFIDKKSVMESVNLLKNDGVYKVENCTLTDMSGGIEYVDV